MLNTTNIAKLTFSDDSEYNDITINNVPFSSFILKMCQIPFFESLFNFNKNSEKKTKDIEITDRSEYERVRKQLESMF
jgi:hypothetical protein